MTTPQPPETESFIKWGITEAKAAELKLRSVHLTYHMIAVLLFAVLFFGGMEAYRFHVAKLARLEAQASVEKARASNEHTLGEKWKARALTLADSVRVDTVRVREIVYRTRSFTVPVTTAAADGTTSVVPMAVVAKADFDSLGLACQRVERDCGSALAAKDSVIAHLDVQALALTRLNQNTASQLTSVKRASFWAKWGYAIIGIAVGRVTAGIH